MNADEHLYRVYKNILNMLYNRGYDIPKNTDSISCMDYETFKKLSNEDLTITAVLRSGYTLNKFPKIIVFFPEDPTRLGVKTIRNYYDRMIDLGINKAILVVKENITPFAKNSITSFTKLEENPVFIEVFLEKSLEIDISKHELVPKHELLSEEEKKALLDKYKIKEVQLAKMMSTDPVSRYYDFHEKDVIKITRPSETGGVYINYRIVI
jgi:DNA-directed RNA polymerase I, II, and III subunit RPABC1